VREVAAEHPELDVRPFDMKGAYTDGSPVLMAGLKCLAFVNHDPSGWIPNWHQPSDNLDHIDPKVLERTELFIWDIIKKLTQ
ncbi:M28 family metallopeptidase, partial [bacterium]|nr:M28 family metallopeptidase [bacterium]